MAQQDLPTGTVTFLITDIEGSTPLFKRLGSRYEAVLADHHRIIRDAAHAHDGVEVRGGGDGFLLAFTTDEDAVAAALDAQLAIGAHQWPADGSVRVRMGLHRGEAKVIDGDYVSFALHQAARVATAAHGGQILLSSALARTPVPEHAAISEIGPFWIRDFDEAELLYEIRHPELVRDLPPPRVPSALVHNLPTHRTTFVGREDEIADLGKLVDTAGLVTLVGPGGIGKTRLAIEVGLSVAGRYRSGVWLVPLSATVSADLVVTAVADALHIGDEPGTSRFEGLIAALADAEALLLFDNCEHVIDGVVAIVEAILARCPSVSILATSREPLSLAAEFVYRVEPLALPAKNEAPLGVAAAPSVELFAQRAAQAERGFAVDGTNATHVATICRELEGIPLALELAAARVGSIGVADLSARLSGGDMLDSARRGGEERHRTVRSTIAWSYDLLEQDERWVFMLLSAFRGGFTAKAVGFAAAYRSFSDADVPTVLEDLAARSLIEKQPDADPVRYRMLEPIRRFASDALREADEWRRAHVGQLAWVLSVTDRVQSPTRGLDRAFDIAELAEENDNIRAALGFAFEDNDHHNIASIISAMASFWVIRTQWDEGVAWCDRALEVVETGKERAHVLFARAQLRDRAQQFEGAREDFTRAAELFVEIGEPQWVAGSHNGIGQSYLHQGMLIEAREELEQALVLYRERGDDSGVSNTLTELTTIAINQGELVQARTWIEDNITISKQTGNISALANAYSYLGFVDAAERRTEQARENLERGRDLFDQLGDRSGLVLATVGLGRAALADRDDEAAVRHFGVASRITKETGDRANGSLATRDLGNALCRLGRHDEALTYLLDALSDALAIGAEAIAWTIVFQCALLRCAQASFDDGVRLLEGSLQKLKEATVTVAGVEAIRVDDAMAAARAALGDEAYERLGAEGRALDLSRACALIGGV